ncbi:MAG: hypothetical protein ABSA97_06695 [Verrucomicrobiia bacterium]
MMPNLRRTGRTKRGIALVLTLGILALVTLLLIAFVTSMRVENMAAKNFNDMIKARQLAQAAVDDAVGQLRFATPSPSVNGTWVAIPGAIISNPTPAGVIYTNYLYTTPFPADAGTTNLNDGYLITGSNSFYYSLANSAITAGWVNVTATIPVAGVPTLVLQGRFAYWVDVEANKANINYASQRKASDPTLLTDPLMNRSDPSDIDLRALEPPFFENLTPNFYLTFTNAHANPLLGQPWFSTVEEMRRGLPAPYTTDDGGGAYQANKFFVTVGTIDTNTDAFGRDRIDLNSITAADVTNANSPIRQRLNDPAWATVLYPGIITDLSRQTFVGKYGQFGVQQILANIIDYQLPYTNPPTADPVAGWVDGIPQLYCGLKKCPMIDEIIVHVATNAVDIGASTSNLEVRVFVDVKLVNGYEIARGNGYVVNVALQGDPALVYANAASVNTWTPVLGAEQTRTLTVDVAAHGFGLLGASAVATTFVGGYPPPTYMTTINGIPGNGVPVLSQVTVRLRHVTLFKSANAADIVDWMAQMDFDKSFPLGMVFPTTTLWAFFEPYVPNTSPDFLGTTAAFTAIGLFKQDIRTRTFPGYGLSTNWFVVRSMDVKPTAMQKYSSRISPEVYRLLADIRSIEPGFASPSQHFPIDQIKESPISNIGELSYIHTGYPWRTIRLRSVYPETSTASPYSYADNRLGSPYNAGVGDPNTGLETVELHALPDWIMLDMFKTGNVATVTGRININEQFTGPANTLTPRFVPLAALLDYTEQRLSTDTTLPILYATNLLSGVPATYGQGLASNIATRVLVPAGGAPNPYAALPAYFTPGQICEVENMGYFSDSTGAAAIYDYNPSKTRRQQIIRRISNLITTRSNLFTIWAVAQSIKKVNTNPATAGVFVPGTDLITGEVRVQAIVERYEDPNFLPTDPHRVKFRTLYYRYYYQ